MNNYVANVIHNNSVEYFDTENDLLYLQVTPEEEEAWKELERKREQQS